MQRLIFTLKYLIFQCSVIFRNMLLTHKFIVLSEAFNLSDQINQIISISIQGKC